MIRYRMCFLQQLLLSDYTLRLAYAQYIRRELKNYSEYLEKMFFSDECIFHTNGAVSNHNARV